jgi:hypothetical protein
MIGGGFAEESLAGQSESVLLSSDPSIVPHPGSNFGSSSSWINRFTAAFVASKKGVWAVVIYSVYCHLYVLSPWAHTLLPLKKGHTFFGSFLTRPALRPTNLSLTRMRSRRSAPGTDTFSIQRTCSFAPFQK